MVESARLSLTGEFRDSELEDQFRRFDFLATRKRVVGFGVIAIALLSVATLGEAWYRGWSNPAFAGIQWTRYFLLGAITAASVVIARLRSPKSLYRIAFLCALALSIIAMRIAWLRPRGYMGHYVADAVLIVAYYMAFQIPFALQVIPPALVSVSDIAMLLFHKTPPDPQYYVVIIGSTVAANVVGILGVRWANFTNRGRFLDYQKEHALSQELQRTLDKVRVLEGLVPICCHCKRIRRDDNYWEEVKAFVRRGSKLEFSHGICPSCMAKFYRDVPPSGDVTSGVTSG